MNARKHGLFSKKEARRREDSIAFENRQIKWMANAQVQDDREEFLVYLNVCQSFDFEHAQRAHDERISSLVENADDHEAEEVYKLGKRLFVDPNGPIGVYGYDPGYRRKRKTLPDGEAVVSPNDPALLVNRLESSKTGCEWLRDQWLGLREPREPPNYWTRAHRLMAVRLLGRQPVDMLEDERVAEIYAAACTFDPVGNHQFADFESDMGPDQLQSFEQAVYAQWPELVEDFTEALAREVLVDLVERNVERLDEMLASYTENAEAIEERRLNRLRLDDSPQSKIIRDFKLKSANAFYRGLDACEKYRKRRKDESWRGGNGGMPQADDMRCERIDQRKRREDGWEQAEDLSWAYEANAQPPGAAQAGNVLDKVRDGTPTGDAATDDLAACSGAQMGSTARNKGNEAKVDENVITTQVHEPVDVVTDFGASQGLDNVAGLPREVAEIEDGEPGRRSDLEADAAAGSGLRRDRDLEPPLAPEDVEARDSPVQSRSFLLASEVSAPS
jgi:hypothetical protein